VGFAWVALPGTLRQRSRVPPKLGPMAPTGAPSAWQHRARRPADTRRARPNWERDRGLARTVGSNRGGDADPDPTLACSRAAHRGGRFPLRRLTTIQDGPSWRATRSRPDHDRGSDQPTERFVYGLYAAKCGERPRSLAVGCVGQLTPQYNSSRSR
jgi:hypothetical protein